MARKQDENLIPRLDDDTYFCYAPTPEKVREIRKRLEGKDE